MEYIDSFQGCHDGKNASCIELCRYKLEFKTSFCMTYLMFCHYKVWQVFSLKVRCLDNIDFTAVVVTCHPQLHSPKHRYSPSPWKFQRNKTDTYWLSSVGQLHVKHFHIRHSMSCFCYHVKLVSLFLHNHFLDQNIHLPHWYHSPGIKRCWYLNCSKDLLEVSSQSPFQVPNFFKKMHFRCCVHPKHNFVFLEGQWYTRTHGWSVLNRTFSCTRHTQVLYPLHPMLLSPSLTPHWRLEPPSLSSGHSSMTINTWSCPYNHGWPFHFCW